VHQQFGAAALDLDADGNGSFEARKLVAWSDFF